LQKHLLLELITL